MKNQIIIYGKHAVTAILDNPKRRIHSIYSTENNLHLVQNRSEVVTLSLKEIENKLQKYGYEKIVHQGIFAVADKLIQPTLDLVLANKPNFLVLLDEMQDSQNLGAIMRSALLFNSQAIITTINNSPDENPQLVKGTSGAFEEIPLVKVVNLTDTMNILKKEGFWIIGLSCKSSKNLKQIIQNFKKEEKIALVLGNEEKGIRPRVEKTCDFLAKITIFNSPNVDSLNASNAAAIALYEINQLLFS